MKENNKAGTNWEWDDNDITYKWLAMVGRIFKSAGHFDIFFPMVFSSTNLFVDEGERECFQRERCT